MNTVRRVMEDAGYRPPKVERQKHDRRYEAVRPNHLWHLDFVQRNIHRANTFTLILIDDHSRYVVGHGVDEGAERADFVIAAFEEAVARHGRPEMVMHDKGAAFWSWNGVSRFTALLTELGIDHLRGRTQGMGQRGRGLQRQPPQGALRRAPLFSGAAMCILGAKPVWVAKEEVWVAKEEVWVAKEENSVAKEGPSGWPRRSVSVAKEEVWVAKEEVWVAKEGRSGWPRRDGWPRRSGWPREDRWVAKEERPMAEEERPVAEEEVWVAKEDRWVAKEEVWVAKEDCWMTQEECWVAKEEVWVAKEEVWVVKEECWVAQEEVWGTQEEYWMTQEECWVARGDVGPGSSRLNRFTLIRGHCFRQTFPQTSPPRPPSLPRPVVLCEILPRRPGQREGGGEESGGRAAPRSKRTPSLSLTRHISTNVWEGNGPGQGEGGMGRVRSAASEGDVCGWPRLKVKLFSHQRIANVSRSSISLELKIPFGSGRGVFASRSSWRPLVTPKPPEAAKPKPCDATPLGSAPLPPAQATCHEVWA